MTPRSRRRECNHCTSQSICVKAIYSASADDLETVCCFFDRHEIGLSPKKVQKPLIDMQMIEQLAKSKSLNALICNELEEDNEISFPGVPLR